MSALMMMLVVFAALALVVGVGAWIYSTAMHLRARSQLVPVRITVEQPWNNKAGGRGNR